MIVDVEAEVGKHKGIRNRDKLEGIITDYKNLARQNAADFNLAGKYNNIARKLQQICDTLPAQNLKVSPATSRSSVSVKTVTISDEENAKIHADWRKRAGKPASGAKH